METSESWALFFDADDGADFFLSSSSEEESVSSMNSFDLMLEAGTAEDFFEEDEDEAFLGADPPLFSALLAALFSFLALARASFPPPFSSQSLYSLSYRDLSSAAFFSHG